ncbi:MAG TPA: D-amino acid aminotransferase [Steroidobacteraceae bacterium]|nr:D-amino acid aminotransferase [Steroidobacteraceae bacterium]
MAEPFPTCWLDGRYLPLAEARVSPLDRGFLFADGVYEVVPVHRGRPFRLRQHLERLERSLAEVRMRNPLTREGWVEVTNRLVAAAGRPELLVYMQATRGAEYGRNHLFPPDAVAPTGFAFVSPYPEPAQALLERGLAATLLEDTRWARCDIKSIALLANVLLRQEAQERGGTEAILVRDGQVTEGSSSTVFIVQDGRLSTPPNSHALLPGTSRDAVLELAEGWLPVTIRDFTADELRAADEVWIASAGRGVLPVSSVDSRPIGAGRPGTAWQRMHAKLQRHLDDIAGRPALEDA